MPTNGDMQEHVEGRDKVQVRLCKQPRVLRNDK